TRVVDFTSDRTALEAALNIIRDIKPQNPAVGGSPFSNVGPVIYGKPVPPSIDSGARTPPRESKVLHDAVFIAAGDLAKRPPDRRPTATVATERLCARN